MQIGALTKIAEVAESKLLAERYPMLVEAAGSALAALEPATSLLGVIGAG